MIDFLEILICKVFNLVVFNIPKGVMLCKEPVKKTPKAYAHCGNSRFIKH